MAWCHYISLSVGAPLLCDLHVITRLASRALGSTRVPKKLVAVSDIFSILRHILSLSQYRLHYLALGSITISVITLNKSDSIKILTHHLRVPDT